MSASTISFWQADRNWYIQQRVRTLSDAGSAAPVVSAVDQSSDAARRADQQAATQAGDELKSAAINALELSASGGYTSDLTSAAALELSSGSGDTPSRTAAGGLLNRKA
ncbi:MAG TPA: hypothetical protein VIY51_20110 [Xanthobacteraceae bacterium]